MESEFEKEKALFDQRVEFLERSLAEKSERERSYITEIHSKRSEITGEIKQLVAKHESEVKLLQAELEEERERVSDIELKLQEKSSELEA